MSSFRLRIMAQVLPFLLITPGFALAQAPPTRGEAAAAVAPAASPAAATYSPQQIDQMVAPIALYPDQLLTQVLMAATYPPQIVEAAQWLQDPGNAALKGDALVAALQPLPWDPSVKALVAFPQIVVMLSDHIEWTQTLGVAFATQQAQVMVRVQALRQLAMKSGRISKFNHLAVRREGTAIVIVPAEADRIYVPVYNPVIVYGAWPDRAFPPVFIPAPARFVGETIEPGIEVSVGYGVVAPLWGWSRPDWRADRVTINRVDYTRITRNAQLGAGDNWRHSGPVVLASPGEAGRSRTSGAALPAGTVAPAAAAAVVGLPQRAASQPKLIQSQTTAVRPGTPQPGQAETTTARPGTQPEQTTTTGPGTTEPGQPERATTARPGATEPGQPERATTARPGATEPGQPERATTARPGTVQPGQAEAPTARPGTQPEQRKAATIPQPREPQATTSNPAVHEPGRTQATTSEPTRRAAPPSAAGGSIEHAPAATAIKPPEAASRAPEHAGARPSPAATPATTHAEQHPASPSETAGHGTSALSAGAHPPGKSPEKSDETEK